MARLESQSKLLYYPTEPAIIEMIASWFTVKTPIRLVDPACGMGAALRQFADLLGGSAETWGIELSYSRSVEAAKVLDRVLPTTFYGVSWARRSVSLAFNNPPYDWSETRDESGKRLRHEYLFVTKTTDKIIAGGHQVILIGQSQMEERLARHLAGWYESFQVFKSGEDYEKFGQIVILACNRGAAYVHPGSKAIQELTCLTDDHLIMGWGKQEESYTDEETGEEKTRKVEVPVFTDIPPMRARQEDEPAWVIPSRPDEDRFSYAPVSHTDMVDAALRCKLTAAEEFRKVTHVKPVGSPFQTAVPPKIGHVSMLLGAGEIGTLPIILPDGRRMLLRGLSQKQKVQTSLPVMDSKGQVTHYNVEEREKPCTVITTITDKEIELVSDINSVGDLITRYADPLASAILQRNPATYGFDPTESEWRSLDGVAAQLPPLPGRDERGLFNAQRHLAIAGKRVLQQHGHLIINGEMGIGKTAMAVSILVLMNSTLGLVREMNQWPALIYCPGHMVGKWRRDTEAIAKPDEPIAARIISDPVRRGRTFYHNVILPLIEEAEGEVTSRERTQVDPIADSDSGGRCRLTVRVSPRNRTRLVRALEQATRVTFRAKRRNGDSGSPSVRLTMTTQFTIDGFQAHYFDQDEYTLFDFASDWQAGRLGKRAVAIVAFDPGKYGAGAVQIVPEHYSSKMGPSKHYTPWDRTQDDKDVRPIPALFGAGEVLKERLLLRWKKGITVVDSEDGKSAVEEERKVRAFQCPICGCHYMDWNKIPDFCAGKVDKGYWHFDESERTDGKEGKWKWQKVEGKCQTPLFEMSRWRREGVARLIQKKFRHLFKIYIADEVHKAQAARTDIGVADSRFIAGTRYSIALTGTLFGGTASSLFYLLYRRNPEVRQNYSYEDGHSLWVNHHGLLKYTYSQDEAPRPGDRGATTNIKRWNYRSTELPGIMPSVIRFLLPITLFARITDLGYQLPPLHEHIERIPMSPEMVETYAKITGPMLKKAVTIAKEDKDPGCLSIWFRAAWMWPNAAFRDAHFTRGEFDWKFKACPGILPKEARLREIVRENREAGRKTLIFVEQSATRDIRERLRTVIRNGHDDVEIAVIEDSELTENENGIDLDLKVSLLSAGDMSPAKRERWIKLHAPTMSALIVNPKLVETGLDLVMFNHIVFYELPLSLYVLWQAQRRVWRLGQKSDVDVTFLVYVDETGHSMEARLLDLMGLKMKFALVLYGDEATGALISMDDDDLEREIIRAALEGKSYADLGEVVQVGHIFSTSETGRESGQTAISASPFGEPTATSVNFMEIEEALEPEPVLVVDDPELEAMTIPVPAGKVTAQLDMFGGLVNIGSLPRSRKRKW
ncbi:MAG: hypothetical protein XU15_C0011G0083 [candidate division NC10 bacterium CSP1-5]|nr:MAG: hypothetical protein XU15_C0011G0083 [candidate division NC10 bacterium CSP1-5]